MGVGYEIARAVTRVISAGHPPALAWRYTPRQLQGWCDLLDRQRIGELHDLLSMMVVAQSGNEKEIKKKLKQLADNSQ